MKLTFSLNNVFNTNLKDLSTHIILIDDDEATNAFHSYVLKKVYPKATLYLIENAIDALSWLRDASNPKPSLALLDINMPLMSGWEFLDELAKDSQVTLPEMFVVFHTIQLNQDQLKTVESINSKVVFKDKPLTEDFFYNQLSTVL